MKTKVLFITRKFPPAVGGMEKYAFELSEALASKADIKLIKWGGSAKMLPLVLPYFLVLSCWKLVTGKFDIIHLQDGLLAPMGVVLKTIFRKPLTVVIHGLDVTYQNSFYQAVVKWSLKRADKIICISEAAQSEVLKRGISLDKTIVIPLGTKDDIYDKNKTKARKYLNDKLNIRSSDKIILSVGRLVERKGVHWFVSNVMPQLVKADPSILFLVSGEGDSRGLVEQAIRRAKLEDRVRLLGRTSQTVRRNLYNGADIFAMPNLPVKGDIEGFGLVLLEASLCELPVVAAGIEGIKDAITDGKNGVLVPTKDAKAIQKAIEKFTTDKPYAAKFGKASRSFTLKNYSWPLIADKFMTVYDELEAH